MSKITFLNNDPTYGKQVSGKTTPEAILVPQGKYSHLLYDITLVPASEGDGEMKMPMPEHYEAERIEMLGVPVFDDIVAAIDNTKYNKDNIQTIILNGDYTEMQRWHEHAKAIASQVLGIEPALAIAKAEKIADIDVYDKSSAVNSFTYQGTEFWLPRETRVSVMNTATILKAAKVSEMTLWLGSVSVNLPVDTVISMLAALEQYALECYNQTATHKYNVAALKSVKAVAAYDITAGYPQKLSF